MGAFSRIRRGRGRQRAVAMAGLMVAVVGGAVACEPGSVSSAAVAYTTDRTATAELTRQHVNVRWLTCTANYGDKPSGKGGASSSTERTVASVDCKGETDDNKDITVTGKVTRTVDGACVRGDLTAEVDGRTWFHVNGLGDCDATTGPTYTPPVTYAPTDGRRPGPTVTVTRTIWCVGDPSCRPVEGK
jgi:hypothetical protein